ncbi:thymosin beta-10-like [Phyllostomus hastatus]|uniref:thymosin beta-10-like n=1 Tax=Phyllostomus hastatus TaxID=9423 RepID=UPI001E67F0B1|nr:thymosin beta-10-like [Phyllostomus hastatus]XP_045703280.1 thymosin beta-10-like [Phyllostomus hastatus]XP_045703281.1 thymosin beta-10-like [Phyllostomus hastatus]
MADKLDMGKIASFDKAELKKTEMQEKNTLPTKETIEQENQGEISQDPGGFLTPTIIFGTPVVEKKLPAKWT